MENAKVEEVKIPEGLEIAVVISRIQPDGSRNLAAFVPETSKAAIAAEFRGIIDEARQAVASGE